MPTNITVTSGASAGVSFSVGGAGALESLSAAQAVAAKDLAEAAAVSTAADVLSTNSAKTDAETAAASSEAQAAASDISRIEATNQAGIATAKATLAGTHEANAEIAKQGAEAAQVASETARDQSVAAQTSTAADVATVNTAKTVTIEAKDEAVAARDVVLIHEAIAATHSGTAEIAANQSLGHAYDAGVKLAEVQDLADAASGDAAATLAAKAQVESKVADAEQAKIDTQAARDATLAAETNVATDLLTIAGLKDQAVAAQTGSETARDESVLAAGEASASALAAGGHYAAVAAEVNKAETAATLSEANKDQTALDVIAAAQSSSDAEAQAVIATTQAGTATDQATLAQAAKIASEAAEAGAVTARTGSETAKSGSEAARDLSAKWAEEDEDVEVTTGAFSAKHHAAKAQATVDGIAPQLLQMAIAITNTNTRYVEQFAFT